MLVAGAPGITRAQLAIAQIQRQRDASSATAEVTRASQADSSAEAAAVTVGDQVLVQISELSTL